MKQDLQIILKARKNIRKRSSVPISFFLDKYFDSCNLLEKINKKIKMKHLNQEARKQHIISLVTALEVYLKETFVSIINKKKIDCLELITKDWKFDFYDIQFILKHKITINELIASCYNF